jgi:hypothetical protein
MRWVDGGECLRGDGNLWSVRRCRQRVAPLWSEAGTKGEICAAIGQNEVWNALLTGVFSTQQV